MKRLLAAVLATAGLAVAQPEPGFVARLRTAIESHLGLPYVWGAAGMKSFDCSGFVYRVMDESGLYMKRTTARKYWFAMPPATEQEQRRFGTIVFFDNLQHMGIVNDKSSFYHAETSKGTNLSQLSPYWRSLICGYRKAGP